MNPISRVDRLREIIIPTFLQALVSLVVSGVALALIQREVLTNHFSNGATMAFSPIHQFNLNVAHILGLYLVGQAAIIIFWAIVGLFAYLVVWWLNNLLITARNEVIVHTSYTNQKAGNFDPIGIILKLATLILLVGSMALLPYGLNGFLRLWRPLLTTGLNLQSIVLVVGSVVGFAAELYLSFMLFQLMVYRFRR